MGNNISIRMTFLFMFCFIFCNCAWSADKGGLVAHWDCDEGSGIAVNDKSGNGNDGKIFGAVFVDSPRGKALSFDGVSNYIDFGNNPSINLKGDVTLMLWIKYKYDGSKRSQTLIFGDSCEPLAIFRNINLRLEEGKNILRFEWANEYQSTVMLTDSIFLDGTWKNIAIVCEYPNCFLFVDGKETNHVVMPFPISPTKGWARKAGGWGHGYYKGELDDIRLYNRALSTTEISELVGLPNNVNSTTTALEACAVYSKGNLIGVQTDVLTTNAVSNNNSAYLEMSLSDSSNILKTAYIQLKETRPGSQRYAQQFNFPPHGLEAGDYKIRASIKDSSGKIINTVTSEKFNIDSQAFSGNKPAWFGSKAGISEKVLPPYTPIRVQKVRENYYIYTVGRSYLFTSKPFISKIKSKDAQLLIAPVRILCNIDGSKTIFNPGVPKLLKSSDAKVVLQQVCSGKQANLIINSTIEYDGFIRMDWSIKAKKSISVDSLGIQYLLDARYVKYLYNWPVSHTGSLLKNVTSEFKPIFWFGDEERGLCWAAESDRYWSVADVRKAIQISKVSKEVDFCLNIIDTPIKLETNGSLLYSFALQATPVHSMKVDGWDYRIADPATWNGYEMSVPEKKVGDVPALKYYADKGAKSLTIWRWWDVFSYVRPIGHEEEFAKAVNAYHDYGLKVMTYYGGFLLSNMAPEWNVWKDEMLVKPDSEFAYSGPLLPGMKLQTCYEACRKGPWQDFLIDGAVRLIDQYGIDGLYLDTTTCPSACANLAHGCGYLRPDGSVAPTYSIFGTRELFKRLYTVVKERKPDGIIEAHVYDCLNIMALSFVTSYWNGEWLSDLPGMDVFRTEFMGRNWGVPADMLYYSARTFSGSTAQALLHDVPTRSLYIDQFDIVSSIWKCRDEFGCKNAEFLPYWSNSKYVSIAPENCYVSLYKHKTNGILVVIANLAKSDVKAEVKINLTKLGIKSSFTAVDAISKKSMDIGTGNFELTLPTRSWQILWIRSLSKQTDKK